MQISKAEMELAEEDDEVEAMEEKQIAHAQPECAKQMQQVMLNEMGKMMVPLAATIEEIKADISLVRFQIGVARSIAENAMDRWVRW